MPAYVIAAKTVEDAPIFEVYRAAVPETLAPFGACFVARGGTLSLLEGEWPHLRLVVIEFPTRQAAEDWNRSEAYQKIISLRLNSTSGNLAIVDAPAWASLLARLRVIAADAEAARWAWDLSAAPSARTF
jgi:uncharacterized protein (DUF1330 family)